MAPKCRRTPWRFERFEPGAAPGGMDADTFGVVVVNGNEDWDLPVGRPGRGHVGAPHRVDGVGDDGAVMVARSTRLTDPAGCQQGVLAHQPQHAAERGANTGDP